MTARGDTETQSEPYGVTARSGADLAFGIELNGYSLAIHEAGRRGGLSIPVQQEVFPGENVFKIVIGTADVPISAPLESVSSPLPEEHYFRLALETERYVPTDRPGERLQVLDVVKQLDWKPEVQDGRIKLPQKLRLEFTAPGDHPVPVWATAEPSTVEELEDAMIAVLREVVNALQAGDVDKVGELNRIAFEGEARAYPDRGDAKAREKHYVEDTKFDLSIPGARVPDLVEPVTCRRVARDLLFECLAEDGESPVRIIAPDGYRVHFNFGFSVIDGELRIVR